MSAARGAFARVLMAQGCRCADCGARLSAQPKDPEEQWGVSPMGVLAKVVCLACSGVEDMLTSEVTS